ncbi:MAG TPA: M13 family metallopeptidase [bacterium]|nr:M13 family metallopeptidase [bacterium]HPN45641.1 M13 family metallopeptidase [bacterium]
MKTQFKIFSVCLVIAAMLCMCAKSNKQAIKPIDPQNMDVTVQPGADFFRYANGNWMKNNQIPDEYARYGAFEQLIEENYVSVRSILDDAAALKNAEKGSLAQKIGDFYATAMDTVTIEKNRLTPLNSEFERINALSSREDILSEIAWLQSANLPALFYIFSEQDQSNSENVIAYLYQGGLGLTDRDYYLSADGHSQDIRAKYIIHLVKMLQLAGQDSVSAAQDAETIMNFETRLAAASNTRLENRNPQNTFNKMDIANLQKTAPGFDWSAYFTAVGLPEPGAVNVAQPKFFTEIGKMIQDTDVQTWKTYLRWNLLNNVADFVSSDFVNQNFNFYGQEMSGTKTLQPRWKRMLQTTNGVLGEAVGQLYVEKYFPPQAKTRMTELVMNLKFALGEHIKNVDWMSDETKQKALQKLEKMNFKIGYPDKWIDYTSLEMNRDSFVENILRANRFEFKRNLDKIGKPVDRTEWGMSPQTVNAYYHPLLNEIVFPAAILQPPYFNMQADDAVNYGAIGLVIGHEMTHGFDDQGRQFDVDGNLNVWWQEEDSERFMERAQKLVDQYNNFTVFDSLHVDGNLTLGENIADLGGLNIALTAYKKSLENKPAPQPIDNFTDMQRFFLSYAQVWRGNIRDKELMRRLKEDVHSPSEFRVNGPIVNIEDFYAAFNIQPGDAMYREPADRAKIW